MKALENYLRDARVLIVDDEPVNVGLLEAFLEDNGMTRFRSTSDPREARGLFREFAPDLVLLDLMMPHLDGFAVMQQLFAEMPPDDPVPVVVQTADNSRKAVHRSLDAGARDFLAKPIDVAELRLRVRNQLETRFLQKGDRRKTALLEKTMASSPTNWTTRSTISANSASRPSTKSVCTPSARSPAVWYTTSTIRSPSSRDAATCSRPTTAIPTCGAS